MSGGTAGASQGATTVEKARRSVAQVGRAPAPPIDRPFAETLADLLPAMGEFGQVQRVVYLPLAGLLHPHQGQAGGLRAGIDLEPHRLQHALLDAAILETDREGVEPMNDGTLACK